MRRQLVHMLILVLVLTLPSLSHSKPPFEKIGEDIEKGLVTVNDIMVEKDRDKALDAIDRVLAMLDEEKGRAHADVHENLVRLKYYLSKYNWDRARRVLKGIMEDLGLDYQPTYP